MLWQEHSPFSLLNNYKHLPLLIKALLTVQLLGYVLVGAKGLRPGRLPVAPTISSGPPLPKGRNLFSPITGTCFAVKAALSRSSSIPAKPRLSHAVFQPTEKSAHASAMQRAISAKSAGAVCYSNC